jgi:hypothetical protein
MFIVAVVWLVLFVTTHVGTSYFIRGVGNEPEGAWRNLGIPLGSWSGGLFLKWALPAFFYVLAMAWQNEKCWAEVVGSGQ